uniref:Uncharacterized protein n=1 Tax=Varanus komodoensis TaxID=61221 RepID=A0A8D2KR17_VARKO
MGLNSSKAPRKVTKVAPMPIKGDRLAPPSSGAVYTFQSSLQERNPSSTASWMGRNPASEKYLPPLRETWQGRYAAGRPTFILLSLIIPPSKLQVDSLSGQRWNRIIGL